jgi:hypothetical protein
VSWDTPNNEWKVQMAKTKKGPKLHIGQFVSDEDGAHAWDIEARKRGYLERKLNFPEK